ncbi:MAG: hypothetical protein ACLFRN_07770 [Halothece sp.]
MNYFNQIINVIKPNQKSTKVQNYAQSDQVSLGEKSKEQPPFLVNDYLDIAYYDLAAMYGIRMM